MIFGVYSKEPACTKLTNGFTLFDWVVRKNCFPDFWGRSVTEVTPEEIAFLKERDCKVALILDNLGIRNTASNKRGADDAVRALEATEKLGISDAAIIAYIPSDSFVNHNWMMRFAKCISDNGCVPGFIGNTDSSKNFNFDRQCGHYIEATVDQKHYGALYGASEPKLHHFPEKWEPYCPSVLKPDDMSLWICGEIFYDGYVVEEMYARDETILKYFI